jgi:predicted NAD/FAD-binding protein
MIREILRFGREARAVLEDDDDVQTVGAYLEEKGYGRAFADHYLVPMGAAIWSCPPDAFRAFPIRFVVDFLDNHRMLDVNGRPTWRVVTGGSQRYVEAMTRGFRNRIHLRTPVRGVRRRPDGVDIETARRGVETFDQVIIACHSDQALRMLADPTPTERELLGAFPYQRNEAVLHTDTSALPRARRAWAAWNYRVPARDRDAVVVTYNMNILQGLRSKHTYCVTLNDTERIDPDAILRTFIYDHPVYTSGRADAQRRHGEVIGVNRTSFCGAYWGYGFHEDGVRSALAVCEAHAGVPA